LFLLTRDKLYQAFFFVANLLMKSFKNILFSYETCSICWAEPKNRDLYLGLVIYP